MITSSAAEIAQRYGVTKPNSKVNGSPAYKIPEVCHDSPNGKKDLKIWEEVTAAASARSVLAGSAPTRPSLTLLALSSRTRDGGTSYGNGSSPVTRSRGPGKNLN